MLALPVRCMSPSSVRSESIIPDTPRQTPHQIGRWGQLFLESLSANDPAQYKELEEAGELLPVAQSQDELASAEYQQLFEALVEQEKGKEKPAGYQENLALVERCRRRAEEWVTLNFIVPEPERARQQEEGYTDENTSHWSDEPLLPKPDRVSEGDLASTDDIVPASRTEAAGEVFRVLVDDNFHLYDESERDSAGAYRSYEEAIRAAKDIVDRSLRHLYRSGMSADELYDDYMDFGDDPFIRPDEGSSPFSAWRYAEGRAASIIESEAPQ